MHILLSTLFANYLRYSPVIMLIIFAGIVYSSLKAHKTLKKRLGIQGRNLRSMFTRFKSLYKTYSHQPYAEEAILNYKKTTIRLFLLWIFALIFYVLLTVFVGVLTSEG